MYMYICFKQITCSSYMCNLFYIFMSVFLLKMYFILNNYSMTCGDLTAYICMSLYMYMYITILQNQDQLLDLLSYNCRSGLNLFLLTLNYYPCYLHDYLFVYVYHPFSFYRAKMTDSLHDEEAEQHNLVYNVSLNIYYV